MATLTKGLPLFQPLRMGAGLGVNRVSASGDGDGVPQASGAASILAARARDPKWNIMGAKAYADQYRLTGHGKSVADAVNAGETVQPWAPSSGIGPGPRAGSAAGAASSPGTPTSARGRFQRLLRDGADVKVQQQAEQAGRAAARQKAGVPVTAPAVAPKPASAIPPALVPLKTAQNPLPAAPKPYTPPTVDSMMPHVNYGEPVDGFSVPPKARKPVSTSGTYPRGYGPRAIPA